MKLNNNQIVALCNAAEKQFKAKQVKPEKYVLSTKEKAEIKNGIKSIKELPEFIKSYIFGSYRIKDYLSEKYWEKHLQNKNCKSQLQFDRRDFADKIHLLSINATDLSSLCKALNITNPLK